MVMSEIKDLNSSREVADLGGSGREFHRRMVSGKRELRMGFYLGSRDGEVVGMSGGSRRYETIGGGVD